MEKHFEMLGHVYTDEARWFDVTRLKLVSKKRVMEVPTLYKFRKEQPTSYVPAGPAEKPTKKG